MINKYIVIIIIAFTVSAAGCASLLSSRQDPEIRLRSRVVDYLNAKRVEDFQKEYEFLTPSYREKITLHKFIQSQKNKLLSISLKQIDYDKSSDTAMVSLVVSMMAMGFELKDLTINQKWVRIDQEWYFDAQPIGFKQLFMPGNAK